MRPVALVKSVRNGASRLIPTGRLVPARNGRFLTLLVLLLVGCGFSGDALAQPPAPPVSDGPVSEAPVSGAPPWASDFDADEAELRELANPEPEPAGDEAADGAAGGAPSGIDLITLIGQGGNFMWPIGVMSMLVVTLAVERMLSFRRRRMLPRKLVRRLDQLMGDGGAAFDPEAAFQACLENRSAAANVIAAMLMRTGRPLDEIERAGSDTAQREADGHAGPIRWLNLAAAATPLMGLLGTVWGMIIAFHTSSALTADRSRSEQLSEGIYVALVTTLAGLAVAIPAAIIAQYLENRLVKIFHRIEELAFTIAPALERFQGRMRMDADARLRPVVPVAGRPAPQLTTSPPTAPVPSASAAQRGEPEKRSRGGGGKPAATSH